MFKVRTLIERNRAVASRFPYWKRKQLTSSKRVSRVNELCSLIKSESAKYNQKFAFESLYTCSLLGLEEQFSVILNWLCCVHEGLVQSFFHKRAKRIPHMDEDNAFSLLYLTLLDCIISFDETRGYRFSTVTVTSMKRRIWRDGDRARRKKTQVFSNSEQVDALSVSDYKFEMVEMIEQEQRQFLHQCLETQIAGLSHVEKLVLTERWMGRKVKTFDEVKQLVGLSKERVRQIQNEAIKKIQKVATSL